MFGHYVSLLKFLSNRTVSIAILDIFVVVNFLCRIIKTRQLNFLKHKKVACKSASHWSEQCWLPAVPGLPMWSFQTPASHQVLAVSVFKDVFCENSAKKKKKLISEIVREAFSN